MPKAKQEDIDRNPNGYGMGYPLFGINSYYIVVAESELQEALDEINAAFGTSWIYLGLVADATKLYEEVHGERPPHDEMFMYMTTDSFGGGSIAYCAKHYNRAKLGDVVLKYRAMETPNRKYRSQDPGEVLLTDSRVRYLVVPEGTFWHKFMQEQGKMAGKRVVDETIYAF